MPCTPLTHIGIIVHDLEAAKARFSEVLGITFRENYHGKDAQFHGHGRTDSLDVEMAFSNEGPVFIELVQSQDNDSVYGSHLPEGVHHVAMFVPDTVSRLAELEAAGIPTEYTISRPEPGAVPHAAYLDATAVHGCRIELLNRLPHMFGYPEQAIVEEALGLPVA